jgi:hypothetical protein
MNVVFEKTLNINRTQDFEGEANIVFEKELFINRIEETDLYRKTKEVILYISSVKLVNLDIFREINKTSYIFGIYKIELFVHKSKDIVSQIYRVDKKIIER